MKFLIKNLERYIDVSKIPFETIEQDMSNIGFEAESYGKEIDASDLIVGYAKKVVKHENSDKLNICTIDTKDGEITIVTGAKNITQDRNVIIVPVGKKVGDLDIVERELRGVMSYGMICSYEEVGFDLKYVSDFDAQGIKLLTGKVKLSDSIEDLLGLTNGILELDILPNRSDVSTYKGLAKEISWRYGIKFSDVELKTKSLGSKVAAKFDKTISSSIVKIDEIQIDNTPNNVIPTLLIEKIKSYSTIEDLTNYYSLITGKPLLSIDADKVKELAYKVNLKDISIKFNEKDFLIKKGSPVIVDGSNIVAIPGILVADEYRTDRNTVASYIESSIVSKENIHNLDQKLKHETKFFARQNKGISSFNQERNLNEFTDYLQTQNVIKSYSEINSSIVEMKTAQYQIDSKYLEHKIGSHIDMKKFADALNRVGYSVELKGDNANISLPLDRVDIHGKADILEDYFRVCGLSDISSEMSGIYLNAYNYDNGTNKLNDKFSNYILGMGLNNILTPELVTPEDAELSNLFNIKDTKKLDDSYNRKKDTLRKGLYTSLLGAFVENKRRKQEDVNLFEITKITNGKNYEYKVGLMFDKYTHNDQLTSNNLTNNFVSVKSNVIRMLNHFGLKDINLNFDIESNIMNPYNKVELTVGKEVIGYIFEIHPSQFIEKKLSATAVYCELNLNLINKLSKKEKSFSGIGTKPRMIKDLTIQVKQNKRLSSPVEEIAKEEKFVSEIKVISVFQSEEQQNSSEKSVTFRIIFDNAFDLNEDVVEKTIKTLTKKLYN